MSKVGKKPIIVPTGVDITIDNTLIRVKGPKGELSEKILDGVHVAFADSVITVTVDNEEKWNLWGLTRTLISNMIIGVTA